MASDPSSFNTSNITDTCSVWNILSSKLLYHASIQAKCVFSCTRFVIYECLHKPRSSIDNIDLKLQERLRKKQQQAQFQVFELEIEDLQDVFVLESRQNLSKGELASMVFAKKTRQAFLTDDQSARKLAEQFIDKNLVQTTPHLYGWLVYSDLLGDSDKDTVIKEHIGFKRPLAKFFEEMHMRALECKLKGSH